MSNQIESSSSTGDAFVAGATDACDGLNSNPYDRATRPACWAAYESGVASVAAARPYWEAAQRRRAPEVLS